MIGEASPQSVMAPKGWLDVHGHFFTPRASKEEDETVKQALRANDFLVTEAPRFDAQATIAYLDRAGVALQMLSYLPTDLEKLQAANDYAASIVATHPSRFGQLVGLPTNNAQACTSEIQRTMKRSDGYAILPDGFAVSTVYKEIGYGAPALSLSKAQQLKFSFLL